MKTLDRALVALRTPGTFSHGALALTAGLLTALVALVGNRWLTLAWGAIVLLAWMAGKPKRMNP